tara:strand:- start:54 stop:512 length:459 start_codon:yes stop_codon:yes gene_type:complete
MVEIKEQTEALVKICMVQRLSTAESLDFLKQNNVKISERTFRRYKSKILEIQNKLEAYSWDIIQEEQIHKMETKRTIQKEQWKVYQSATKPSEQLAILKAIEKTSNELPEVVYTVNHYGDDIESTIRSRKMNELYSDDYIFFPEKGQKSRLN